MEKYRQWADGGTGANPFVPAWSHHRAPLVARALKALVFGPVALLRLLVFAVALLWLALAEVVCALIPVGILRYPVYQLLSSTGCRVALLALGVLPMGDALADHRRLKILPPKSANAQAFDASRGTFVLANRQGLTDVLFLGLRLCPTFVFVAADGAPMAMGLLGALRRAAAAQPPAAPAAALSLAEIARAAQSAWRGPVVIFPEGANTNGSCVLAWKPRTFEGMESMDEPAGVALAALQYSKTGGYTPHHTVGSAFRHLFWLAFQPWHTVRAQWLPAGEVAGVVKGKPLAEQRALLRTVLARMLPGAVEVEVAAESHAEFAAYWDASQRKRYTRQQPQQPPPQQQQRGAKKRA